VYEVPDHLYYPEEKYTVVECLDCGLGFVNPRPSMQEMSRFYPSTFYDYFSEVDHTRRYENEYRYLGDPFGSKLMLDVGCANGDFPRFVKAKGWSVEGVEISPNSVQISDFPIHRIPFDQLQGKDSCYDAVTAWAVLEHVHDPMAYFKKAGEVLKPGGRFIFLVTNFSSISSKRLFGEDVPRHLYFFTKDTVRRYVEAAGMEIEMADFGSKVYLMRPRGWLIYYITRYLKRRNFEWQDMPIDYGKFIKTTAKTRSPRSMLKYILSNPLPVIDRVLLPLVEVIQKLTNNYGIVTYAAIKR